MELSVVRFRSLLFLFEALKRAYLKHTEGKAAILCFLEGPMVDKLAG